MTTKTATRMPASAGGTLRQWCRTLPIAVIAIGGVASAAPDEAEPSLDAAARELAIYEKTLEDALTAQGPYSPALAETYQGFGHYLQQLGRHQDALAVLRKARHVARINQGIHGASQIPVLQAMIRSLRATGQLTATTTTYQELVWVIDKGLPAGDLQRVPALRDAAHWLFAASRLDAEEHRLAHLLAAQDLIGQAETLAEQQPIDVQTRAALLRDRALLHFHVLRERDTRHRAPQMPPGYRFVGDAPHTGVQTLPASASAAHELLDARIALLERERPAGHAALRHARLERADWALMFGDLEAATAAYRAWLSEATTADRESLAIPQPLPMPRDDRGPNIRIRVDISADGRPQNVELLDVGPFTDSSDHHRMLQTVRETRFRPAFLEGQAVASTGTLITFPLAD